MSTISVGTALTVVGVIVNVAAVLLAAREVRQRARQVRQFVSVVPTLSGGSAAYVTIGVTAAGYAGDPPTLEERVGKLEARAAEVKGAIDDAVRASEDRTAAKMTSGLSGLQDALTQPAEHLRQLVLDVTRPNAWTWTVVGLLIVGASVQVAGVLVGS